MTYISIHKVKAVILEPIKKQHLSDRIYWTKGITIITEENGDTQMTLFAEEEANLVTAEN